MIPPSLPLRAWFYLIEEQERNYSLYYLYFLSIVTKDPKVSSRLHAKDRVIGLRSWISWSGLEEEIRSAT